MEEDTEYVGALEIVALDQRAKAHASSDRDERLRKARDLVDEARLVLSELAAPAVAVIALRLQGIDTDWDGRPVTIDRETTAMAILDRVGIPKLRATAIAASLMSSTTTPAPGSPGWESLPQGDGTDGELDPSSVDAHIQAFLDGARVARDLRGE
jgi:hypothetical protein